jgi:hypothetical protein
MASITKAFTVAGSALADLTLSIKDCDSEVTEKELEIFTNMLKAFKDPQSLAIKAGSNIVLNGVEVYREISAAYTNYKVQEFEGFGRDLGIALALVFIGACEGKNCDGAKKAMHAMIEGQLYPTSINDDDNSMYIAYLDMVLRDRQNAEWRAEHPYMETDDDLVAAMPVDEVQSGPILNMLNLMSQRDQASYLY